MTKPVILLTSLVLCLVGTTTVLGSTAVAQGDAGTAPSTPRNVQVELVGNDAHITWDAPAGGTPDRYLVYDSRRKDYRIGGSHLRDAWLWNLDHGTTYYLGVRARNDHGTSRMIGYKVTLPTEPEIPPSKPRRVRVELVGNDAHITWEAPAEGTPDRYLVYDSRRKDYRIGGSHLRDAWLWNLDHGTTYYLGVRARNDHGTSRMIGYKVTLPTEPETAPSRPQNVRVKIVGDDAHITWEAPAERNADDYLVYDSRRKDYRVVGRNQREAWLHQLTPDTFYYLGVRARNHHGVSRLAGKKVYAGLWAEWDSLAAGGAHTCGTRNDQTAWCWGDNSSGQLGDDTTTDTAAPAQLAVPDTWNWTSLAAGGSHTCGIRRDGTAWCWGNNTHGELGDGTTTDSPTPTPVDAPASWHWNTLTAGDNHTCGIRRDGTAWCWGNNTQRQLGNQYASNAHAPEPVYTPSSWSWTTLTAGRSHTCGVRENSTAWCWGSDALGQRGDEVTASTPSAVDAGSGEFTMLTAGRDHTCWRYRDGTATCWGSNSDGQLGDGTGTDQSDVPVPVIDPDT